MVTHLAGCVWICLLKWQVTDTGTETWFSSTAVGMEGGWLVIHTHRMHTTTS